MINDYDNKTLKAYCHYPIKSAMQECKNTLSDIYRIVTIDLTIATSENLGVVDYEHVHKNIYEMALSEFIDWLGIEDNIEIVVSIEKINNI